MEKRICTSGIIAAFQNAVENADKNLMHEKNYFTVDIPMFVQETMYPKGLLEAIIKAKKEHIREINERVRGEW